MGLICTLSNAFKLIPKTPVHFSQNIGAVENEIGYVVPNYAPEILINNAIIQAVSSEVYHKIGLDFQKNYKTIFIERKVFALNGVIAPDRFRFNGVTWQVIQTEDWFEYDNYVRILVVELKNEKI